MTGMFLIIAIVASAFLGIQLLLLMFGADMDFDSDMDVDAGDGGGFMSVRSLTAFFGGFGWAGLAARQAGWSGVTSILVGIAVGAGMFLVVGFLFIQARKLSSDANLDYSTAIGQGATVYLPIGESRQSVGKVEVTISGRLSTVNALTDDSEPIPSKSRVRIVELVDATTLLVERA